MPVDENWGVNFVPFGLLMMCVCVCLCVTFVFTDCKKEIVVEEEGRLCLGKRFDSLAIGGRGNSRGRNIQTRLAKFKYCGVTLVELTIVEKLGIDGVVFERFINLSVYPRNGVMALERNLGVSQLFHPCFETFFSPDCCASSFLPSVLSVFISTSWNVDLNRFIPPLKNNFFQEKLSLLFEKSFFFFFSDHAYVPEKLAIYHEPVNSWTLTRISRI